MPDRSDPPLHPLEDVVETLQRIVVRGLGFVRNESVDLGTSLLQDAGHARNHMGRIDLVEWDAPVITEERIGGLRHRGRGFRGG